MLLDDTPVNCYSDGVIFVKAVRCLGAAGMDHVVSFVNVFAYY